MPIYLLAFVYRKENRKPYGSRLSRSVCTNETFFYFRYANWERERRESKNSHFCWKLQCSNAHNMYSKVHTRARSTIIPNDSNKLSPPLDNTESIILLCVVITIVSAEFEPSRDTLPIGIKYCTRTFSSNVKNCESQLYLSPRRKNIMHSSVCFNFSSIMQFFDI